jgi:hypothetical protein
VLEAGEGQAREVADELRNASYKDIVITRDLSGRNRVVEGRRA